MIDLFKRGNVAFSQEWFRKNFNLKDSIIIVGASYDAERNQVFLSFIDTEGKTLPVHSEMAFNQTVDLETIQEELCDDCHTKEQRLTLDGQSLYTVHKIMCKYLMNQTSTGR